MWIKFVWFHLKKISQIHTVAWVKYPPGNVRSDCMWNLCFFGCDQSETTTSQFEPGGVSNKKIHLWYSLEEGGMNFSQEKNITVCNLESSKCMCQENLLNAIQLYS